MRFFTLTSSLALMTALIAGATEPGAIPEAAAPDAAVSQEAAPSDDSVSISETEETAAPTNPYCGAYVGVGLGFDAIKRELRDKTTKGSTGYPPDGGNQKLNSSSANGAELALIVGTGKTLGNNVYLGAELDVTGSTASKEKGETITNTSGGTLSEKCTAKAKQKVSVGLAGMLGYYVQSSNVMPFLLIGARQLQSSYRFESLKGSTYTPVEVNYSSIRPTVGAGIMKKFGKHWTARFDVTHTFSSSGKKDVPFSDEPNSKYTFESKINRTAVRLIGMYTWY